MSYALLAVGLVSLVLALTALWPPRRYMSLVIPGFFTSWVAIEMAPHLLVLEAAGLGLLAAYGGLDA